MTTITGSKPAEEVAAFERKQDAMMTLSDAEVLAWIDAADISQIKKAIKLLVMGHRELVKKGVL